MQAGERVARPEEMPEQAVAVEIAGEYADAAAAEHTTPVPVGARGGVEAGAQPLVVDVQVCAGVGTAEEAEERMIVRQMPERTDLELAERHMRSVEIDRGDAHWIGGEIGEHVAPARGYGDDLVARPDLERLHIDDRIFPNLRIDEFRERQGEHALKHARPRQGLGAMDGCLQGCAGRLPDRFGHMRQLNLPSCEDGKRAR